MEVHEEIMGMEEEITLYMLMNNDSNLKITYKKSKLT